MATVGRYTWILGLAFLFLYVWAFHRRAAWLRSRNRLDERVGRTFLRASNLGAALVAIAAVAAQAANPSSSPVCAYYATPLTLPSIAFWLLVFGILTAMVVAAALPRAAGILAQIWPIVAVAKPLQLSYGAAQVRWRTAITAFALGVILVVPLVIAVTRPEQFPC